MALRPSSVPQRVVLPEPPASSLPHVPDPEFDLACATCPTVTCLLAIVVTDPNLESTAAFVLVTELVDFVARSRLDYVAGLVTKSESVCPPSVGGEHALGSDVLEDRLFELECLAVVLPRFASMLLCLEGDLDALDIPTPRSYAKAIVGEYSSQWQTAMDTEMASCKPTSTYVDEVPPLGANIVDGMWVFRVKRPPGSPPAFKARYVARGFSHRQGVDYFQNFPPTLKMTTLWGSLHEEICLRHPPGFTGSFLAGTQWSLRGLGYGLRQAPREWHNTLRTTFAAPGFAPSSADPSLFLRIDTTMQPFYILVYVDDLVFATADTEALALVNVELQERHTCTDLGPSVLRLPVSLATAHSSAYWPIVLSSIFGRVRRAKWSRLEHKTKHIALRYILARELQQCGQLRLSYVASRANTADVFTGLGAYLQSARARTAGALACTAARVPSEAAARTRDSLSRTSPRAAPHAAPRSAPRAALRTTLCAAPRTAPRAAPHATPS
ncbi:unnamed protein product [Closterium sp. NIES-53]